MVVHARLIQPNRPSLGRDIYRMLDDGLPREGGYDTEAVMALVDDLCPNSLIPDGRKVRAVESVVAETDPGYVKPPAEEQPCENYF